MNPETETTQAPSRRPTPASLWRGVESELTRNLKDATDHLANLRERVAETEAHRNDLQTSLREWRALGRAAGLEVTP